MECGALTPLLPGGAVNSGKLKSKDLDLALNPDLDLSVCYLVFVLGSSQAWMTSTRKFMRRMSTAKTVTVPLMSQ